MKVIFIKDLKKQAKKGEIKEVKDGYANNFLIKNGYAVQVTEKNMETVNNILQANPMLTEKNMETVKKENEAKKQEEKILTEEANKVKKELEKITLVFKVKTGDKDRVFGSISPKQIKEELLKKGYKIDKKQIELNSSLQSLGFHKVTITLYKEIKAECKVQLVK